VHADLKLHDCTIEEREEYEPYVALGIPVFAGVDYAAVLASAEAESDVIVWDGGNNDYPFLKSDLWIVVADALRPGHEVHFFPGETNFRSAQVIVINKVEHAAEVDVAGIRERAGRLNPSATVITSELEIGAADGDLIRGRRVLVVEDGPTLTHGGMSYGAGTLAARRFGAAELIDPRPHAVGSIASALHEHPHIGNVLPALGYSQEQRRELAESIDRCRPEIIVDASPARLDFFLETRVQIVRVRYEFRQIAGPPLKEIVDQTLVQRLDSGPAR
jgi:predicted GTPase